MKFNTGALEKYYIKTVGTKLENNPAIKIVLKEEVNGELLKEAFLEAVERFPLFGSVLKYEKDYTFQTLEGIVNIYNVNFDERPTAFGSCNDGLLYQLSYYENEILFEWSNIITDEKGALLFFSILMDYYVGQELEPVHYPLPLEHAIEFFMDKKATNVKQVQEIPGFKQTYLPYDKTMKNTNVHILKVKKEEVLKLITREDKNITAVLVPLYSRALRKHLDPKASNKNVKVNVRLDLRTTEEIHSYRNCLITNHITYVDRYDNLDINHLHTIYNTFLNLAEEPDAVKLACTQTYHRLQALNTIRPKLFIKPIINSIKHKDSNYTYTNLGKIPFSKESLEHIESVHINSNPTYGECAINVYELDEDLYLNISENYLDKEVINTFVTICSELNINLEEIANYIFNERTVVLEKK